MTTIIVIPILGFFGLIFALITFLTLLKKPEGLENMAAIAHEVHKGAMVFLKNEYRIILIFIILIFFIIAKFLSLTAALAYISGAFLSINACMPSFWSSEAKQR